MEAVCQAHPRLHLEAFPAYAPERNPAEQIWNDFKGHTANRLWRDTRDIAHRLRANIRQVSAYTPSSARSSWPLICLRRHGHRIITYAKGDRTR
jgi:hypothetical protein